MRELIIDMADIVFMHVENEVRFIQIWIPFFFDITDIRIVIVAVAVIVVITRIDSVMIIIVDPREFTALLT
jgi:hypothetical protein